MPREEGSISIDRKRIRDELWGRQSETWETARASNEIRKKVNTHEETAFIFYIEQPPWFHRKTALPPALDCFYFALSGSGTLGGKHWLRVMLRAAAYWVDKVTFIVISFLYTVNFKKNTDLL